MWRRLYSKMSPLPLHLSDTKIRKRDEKSKLFQLKDVKGNVKKKAPAFNYMQMPSLCVMCLSSWPTAWSPIVHVRSWMIGFRWCPIIVITSWIVIVTWIVIVMIVRICTYDYPCRWLLHCHLITLTRREGQTEHKGKYDWKQNSSHKVKCYYWFIIVPLYINIIINDGFSKYLHL